MNTVSASQTRTTYSPKRGYRFWLSRFAILLVLPFVLYYGYCWGLWGRHSLLLQYLFQCGCPVASNETRYPEEMDVIVPACRYVSSMLSPSGNFLYVQEKATSRFPSYFLDLRNNEKKPSFIPPRSTVYFLTDDLLFLSLEYGHDDYQGGEYILDRMTGKQYPIRRSDGYVGSNLNLDVLADTLREVQDVFLIGERTIVALASDFSMHPERNFYVDRGTFPGYEEKRAEQFLRENNIQYHSVPDYFPGEVLSPDKRFVARKDGIYLTETDQKIVEAYFTGGGLHSYSGKYFSVRGWTYDGTGVIYSKFLKPCLIEIEPFFIDATQCYVAVSQPLLKLKIPGQYLLPSSTP